MELVTHDHKMPNSCTLFFFDDVESTNTANIIRIDSSGKVQIHYATCLVVYVTVKQSGLLSAWSFMDLVRKIIANYKLLHYCL